MKRHLIISALMALPLFTACEAPTDPDLYKPEVVVKAFLPVGEGIDSVYISQVLPLTAGYTFEQAALSGVIVRVTDQDGNSTQLTEYAGKRGIYGDLSYVIKPKTTYSLYVEAAGFPVITATTTTPGALNPLIVNKTVLSYIGDSFNGDSLTIRWNEVEGSVNYLVSVRYTGPDSSKIRIESDFNDDEDENFEEDPNVQSSWVNRTNGRLYGFFHKFYGPHRVTIVAMDQNLYNYIKTQFQSSRQVNEPLFNLSSGVGYFASGSRRSVDYQLNF
ncbi:MAG: DUF4249 family protein [Bacteroidetes bacterium]|nr:DUF4249 family protein [Bacteroidota bacterium]